MVTHNTKTVLVAASLGLYAIQGTALTATPHTKDMQHTTQEALHVLDKTLKELEQHKNLSHCKRYHEHIKMLHSAIAPHPEASQTRTVECLFQTLPKLSQSSAQDAAKDAFKKAIIQLTKEKNENKQSKVGLGTAWTMSNNAPIYQAIIEKLPVVLDHALNDLASKPLNLDGETNRLEALRSAIVEKAQSLLSRLSVSTTNQPLEASDTQLKISKAIVHHKAFAVLRSLMTLITISGFGQEYHDHNVLFTRVAPLLDKHLEDALIQALSKGFDETELKTLSELLHNTEYLGVRENWPFIWRSVLDALK